MHLPRVVVEPRASIAHLQVPVARARDPRLAAQRRPGERPLQAEHRLAVAGPALVRRADQVEDARDRAGRADREVELWTARVADGAEGIQPDAVPRCVRGHQVGAREVTGHLRLGSDPLELVAAPGRLERDGGRPDHQPGAGRAGEGAERGADAARRAPNGQPFDPEAASGKPDVEPAVLDLELAHLEAARDRTRTVHGGPPLAARRREDEARPDQADPVDDQAGAERLHRREPDGGRVGDEEWGRLRTEAQPLGREGEGERLDAAAREDDGLAGGDRDAGGRGRTDPVPGPARAQEQDRRDHEGHDERQQR